MPFALSIHQNPIHPCPPHLDLSLQTCQPSPVHFMHIRRHGKPKGSGGGPVPGRVSPHHQPSLGTRNAPLSPLHLPSLSVSKHASNPGCWVGLNLKPTRSLPPRRVRDFSKVGMLGMEGTEDQDGLGKHRRPSRAPNKERQHQTGWVRPRLESGTEIRLSLDKDPASPRGAAPCVWLSRGAKVGYLHGACHTWETKVTTGRSGKGYVCRVSRPGRSEHLGR